MTARRLSIATAAPLIALAIGVAVAVASSLGSFSTVRRGATSSVVEASLRALASPTPTVAAPGTLGASPRLLTNGSNTIVGVGSNFAVGSTDGGHSWTVIRPPANGLGLFVDPANPSHAITGGSNIQVTNNAGVVWTPATANPPGKGPYVPLAISPAEPNVWFFVHGNKLLVTRDGSATWIELSVPQIANAYLVQGLSLGQFFLVSGNRIFRLSNNGLTITEEPSLSANALDVVAVGGPDPTLLARVPGQVYRLQGSTWLPTGRDLRGPIAAGADGTMLIGNGGEKLGVRGEIGYSTDGVNWAAASGLPSDQTVEAIAGQFDSRNFFAYCYGGDMYVSTDGGHSWSLVTNQLRTG